jgi:hypothetical protein
MSVTAPNPTDALDPQYGLVVAVGEQIVSLFKTPQVTLTQAREATVLALHAYHPEGQADHVSAARILAFSMAALSALRLAAAEDVPLAMKLRLFDRANSLNRSADQAERRMAERRQDLQASPPVVAADRRQPPAVPAADPLFDDAAIAAAVEEAMAAFHTAQTLPEAGKTTPEATPGEPAPATADTLSAALRFTGPLPAGSGPGPMMSYRQDLLRRSALPRMVAEDGHQTQRQA